MVKKELKKQIQVLEKRLNTLSKEMNTFEYSIIDDMELRNIKDYVKYLSKNHKKQTILNILPFVKKANEFLADIKTINKKIRVILKDKSKEYVKLDGEIEKLKLEMYDW